MFETEKRMLPAFPRTPHLPFHENLGPGDVVAEDASAVFGGLLNAEEKVDGASVGMAVLPDGHPVIRNRDHVLRKGYFKDTAAKKQFGSVWTWFYDRQDRFEALAAKGPYSVYGEWCLARHGIEYTRLPEWFVAYDIYNYEKAAFLPPPRARTLLGECGFATPALFHQGEFLGGYEDIAAWAHARSAYADEEVEGVYLKVYDTKSVTGRFKMVSPDFKRGQFWDAKKLTRNRLGK